MVAALTGANVLEGLAFPRPQGATICPAGGGELVSSARAQGPVQIAIHPWELELSAPEHSDLVDTVVSVRPERGGLLIRCTRFRVQSRFPLTGGLELSPGRPVGLRAAPDAVRVLEAPSPAGSP
jgi:hypothetical protein